MISLSSASLTVTLDKESSLSAKDLVKPAGICCTTTIPQGKFAGRRGITACRALGPPVEVPKAISFVEPPVPDEAGFAGVVLRLASRIGLLLFAIMSEIDLLL